LHLASKRLEVRKEKESKKEKKGPNWYTLQNFVIVDSKECLLPFLLWFTQERMMFCWFVYKERGNV